ncbi:MAG: efflux RND transporter periplasmic adaptor subunit [Planctomycetota bacterium]|nr:efflux RND transporter periplasmic adaptor subunit [Planctomycetota bacterium]MDA1113828.1 efflux RND transporter periplasmic adaptor subunit [Planctomycetota bacterium]
MKLLIRIALPVLVLVFGFLVKNYLVATGPLLPPQDPEFLIPLVEITVSETETTTLDVTAFGEVRPRSSSSVVAEVAARVTFVSDKLYRGAFFEEGEVLLRLDDTDYVSALAVRQATQDQAAAALELEQAAVEIAKQEWELLGKGEASAAALRKPQLAAAVATMRAAVANVRIAQNNLQRTTIRAPYAGRTQMRNVELGNWVTPGSPLATIYAIDAAEISLPLPANALGKLGLSLAGPSSEIRVDFQAVIGDSTEHWQGHLVRTDSVVDPTTRMIGAIALLENPFQARENGSALAPGMFLHATIRGREVQGIVRIPRHALRMGNLVWVMNAENRAEEREVTVLQNTVIESLIASGLEQGDRVILTELPLFVDGMQVRLEGEEQ